MQCCLDDSPLHAHGISIVGLSIRGCHAWGAPQTPAAAFNHKTWPSLHDKGRVSVCRPVDSHSAPFKSAKELHLQWQAWLRAAHLPCVHLQKAPLQGAPSDSDMAGSSALQEVLQKLSTAPTVRRPHEVACIHDSASLQSLLRLVLSFHVCLLNGSCCALLCSHEWLDAHCLPQ